MPISDAQAADYARYARRPDIWVVAARRSLAVALLLNRQCEELRVIRSNPRELLSRGVAIENAANAVQVSRNPAIVSSGRLDKRNSLVAIMSCCNPSNRSWGRLQPTKVACLQSWSSTFGRVGIRCHSAPKRYWRAENGVRENVVAGRIRGDCGADGADSWPDHITVAPPTG